MDNAPCMPPSVGLCHCIPTERTTRPNHSFLLGRNGQLVRIATEEGLRRGPRVSLDKLEDSNSGDRANFPGDLSKLLFHGTHRQEEPSLASGEFEKSILLVKHACRNIFRVDDDICGSHFSAVVESSI